MNAVSAIGETGAAAAHPIVRRCPPDAVKVGDTCVDGHEASAWLVPNPTTTNKRVVNKIVKGTVTLADLTTAGATQLGNTGPTFNHGAFPANFPANGNWTLVLGTSPPTPGVDAVSIAGVLPTTSITWFQAQQACRLSGKHLIRNDEWQAAAQSTPDPGTDNGTSDCAVASAGPALTGARSNCVSAWRARDMVGNVWEWVADWGDQASGCANWSATFGSDSTCFGESGGSRFPGALLRGGFWLNGTGAGVFAAIASLDPSAASDSIGFRCAR